jgi:hypothetical protein
MTCVMKRIASAARESQTATMATAATRFVDLSLAVWRAFLRHSARRGGGDHPYGEGYP